ERLLDAGEPEPIGAFLETLPSGEVARAVSRLDDADQDRLLTTLPPEDAADIVQELSPAQASDLLEELAPAAAAAILGAMPSDDRADVVAEMGDADAQAILAVMSPEEAAELRSLLAYADHEAGGLMVTEFVAFRRGSTVQSVVETLRARAEEFGDYDVQYVYVVGARRELVGVLRLRDLLLSPALRRLEELMLPDPVHVSHHAPLDELEELFDRHDYVGVPVVDDGGVLVGVVQRSAVGAALADRRDDDYRKSQGLVQEELRTMPVRVRSGRRLAWLSLNVVLNLLGASVIAMHEETLEAAIALAVFLPIISDMSGNSGNQAVAVTMRELALGLVRPADFRRVLVKELQVGVLNGLALGSIVAGVAWAYSGNPWIGLVVGSALAANTLVAVSIGGVIPLVLRALRRDPALASGPILTTITDLCGFLIVLSVAARILPRLTTG
ncbi:MAG TPA: magnesium transporter, partial [Planctomycetota bacterium]|nr:magnesium transporter [Planctomycetota bacterium]